MTKAELINKYGVERYEDQLSKNKEAHKAKNNARVQRSYCRPGGMTVYRSRQDLIENGRYYNCPANELIFLTNSDHIRLHNNLNRRGKK